MLFSPSLSLSFFLFRATTAAYGSSQAEVKSELQVLAYATGMPDLSLILGSWQCWILNPLSEVRNQTRKPAWILVRFISTDPQWELHFSPLLHLSTSYFISKLSSDVVSSRKHSLRLLPLITDWFRCSPSMFPWCTLFVLSVAKESDPRVPPW